MKKVLLVASMTAVMALTLTGCNSFGQPYQSHVTGNWTGVGRWCAGSTLKPQIQVKANRTVKSLGVRDSRVVNNGWWGYNTSKITFTAGTLRKDECVEFSVAAYGGADVTVTVYATAS